MDEIQLGDTVRDVITGYTGVAVERLVRLFGETSIRVQSRDLFDGNVREMEWFEEKRLEKGA